MHIVKTDKYTLRFFSRLHHCTELKHVAQQKANTNQLKLQANKTNKPESPVENNNLMTEPLKMKTYESTEFCLSAF